MRTWLTAVLFSPVMFIHAQREQDYLQTYAAIWNQNGFRHIEKVFDRELLRNQLYLIGESHGVQYTHQIEFDLVRHLKKKTGFRFLLMELGFLDEIYLNRYLATGNENVLDSFFQFHPATFFYNKSEQKFFRDLYSFNKNLSEKQRIRVMAIDLEFAHREAIAFLQREKFSALPSIEKRLMDSIQSQTDSSAGLIKKFRKAYDYFVNNTSAYRKHLGEQYEEVRHMMENIQNRIHIAITRSSVLRDSVMLENFKWAVNRHGLKNEKMVGIIGSFHARQADHPVDPKFAALLKKNDLVKGIVSISFAYNEGEVMIPARNFPDAEDARGKMFVSRPNGNGVWTNPIKQWDLLEPFFKRNKAWLFRLDRKDSPFNTSTAFTTTDDEPYFTTELFQVLVLINNSPATVSYDE